MKLGELVLKGLNRRSFEDKLISNAMRRLRPHGVFRVYSKQSTMYVEPRDDSCDMDGAWEAMKKLFGVVGLSRARACGKDKQEMLETAKTYLCDQLMAARSFKVEAKRADKSFPMTSIQLALAFPSTQGGVFASALEFLGIFAPTQLPLAVVEGILTVLIMMALENYAKPELKSIGFFKA